MMQLQNSGLRNNAGAMNRAARTVDQPTCRQEPSIICLTGAGKRDAVSGSVYV